MLTFPILKDIVAADLIQVSCSVPFYAETANGLLLMSRPKRFILLAVQIEASFVSPLPRSKRNHRHCGSFQVSLDFSMA